MQEINISKINGLINIAKKAGYLIIGADNLKNYSKKLYLILESKDAGQNLIKITERLKLKTNCDLEKIENETFFQITKLDNCKVIGIKNKGLAEEIKKYLRGDKID